MHLIKLNKKGFGVWETTNQGYSKGQPAFSRKSAAGWPFFLSHIHYWMSIKFIGGQIMPRPDFDFWMQLAHIQVINEKLKKILDYTEHSGVPMDLNHPQGKSEIEAFKHFATSLEDKALEFVEIAETITTYTAEMEEILSEKENELLPDEGNSLHQVGA